MKATPSTQVQAGTTAPRTTRQKGIIKEVIGLTDVKTLRARARQGIADEAMTAGYKAKAETVITLLNDALATEIVCVLRYKPLLHGHRTQFPQREERVSPARR